MRRRREPERLGGHRHAVLRLDHAGACRQPLRELRVGPDVDHLRLVGGHEHRLHDWPLRRQRDLDAVRADGQRCVEPPPRCLDAFPVGVEDFDARVAVARVHHELALPASRELCAIGPLAGALAPGSDSSRRAQAAHAVTGLGFGTRSACNSIGPMTSTFFAQFSKPRASISIL